MNTHQFQKIEKWIWAIDQPILTQMQLTIPETQLSGDELREKQEKLIGYVSAKVNEFIVSGEKMTRELLELVQLVQSPFVKNEIPDHVVATASEILKSIY